MLNQINIIISGNPCTGKSTIGKLLSDDLKIPYVSKDTFKELMFDTFETNDRETSKKFGRISIEVLYWYLNNCIDYSRSCIVDSNFENQFAVPVLKKIHEKSNLIEIHCKCDTSILKDRFKKRIQSGNRHAGHDDAITTQEIFAKYEQGSEPLNLGGPLLICDTAKPIESTMAEITAFLIKHQNIK